MKEIKFRGYVVDKMLENQWQYGFGVLETKYTDGTREYTLFTSHGTYEVHPKSIGQYIGLKDINNKDIYGGDIVLTSLGQKIVVKYSKLYAGYIPFVSDGGCGCCSDDFTRHNPENVKVIGNVFENPDLIKG